MIEDLWYKNAVIYSLDLETFMDASGDGIGDFEGLMRRLDYLSSLGVDALWLAPFQPSPNRDNGYDIIDFYGVDPRHGSSGDFVALMHGAKQRGLKVLLDLVVNHTSAEHPWFVAACKDENSPYRNWYIWEEKSPPTGTRGFSFQVCKRPPGPAIKRPKPTTFTASTPFNLTSTCKTPRSRLKCSASWVTGSSWVSRASG